MVAVTLSVHEDGGSSEPPRSSGASSSGASTPTLVGGSGGGFGRLLRGSADGGSAVAAAAAAAAAHQCARTSWACRLGLCRLCNAKLLTVGDDPPPAAAPEPRVSGRFTIQGGLGAFFSRHHRMFPCLRRGTTAANQVQCVAAAV